MRDYGQDNGFMTIISTKWIARTVGNIFLGKIAMHSCIFPKSAIPIIFVKFSINWDLPENCIFPF